MRPSAQVAESRETSWRSRCGMGGRRSGGRGERVSTTRASCVEPPARDPIKPGQRVAHLFPRAVMEEYVLQRVTERVWWVSRHFYGSLFYVGRGGVAALD